MLCIVIQLYRNNLIIGAFNVFINDLDPRPAITLACLLQTKLSIYPDMDRAALLGMGGESRPGPAPSSLSPAHPLPAAPQVSYMERLWCPETMSKSIHLELGIVRGASLCR